MSMRLGLVFLALSIAGLLVSVPLVFAYTGACTATGVTRNNRKLICGGTCSDSEAECAPWTNANPFVEGQTLSTCQCKVGDSIEESDMECEIMLTVGPGAFWDLNCSNHVCIGVCRGEDGTGEPPDPPKNINGFPLFGAGRYYCPCDTGG